jgi:hypothetical protein
MIYIYGTYGTYGTYIYNGKYMEHVWKIYGT